MTVEELLAALQAIIDGAKGEDGAERALTEDEMERYEKLENQLQATRKSEEIVKRNAAYGTVVTPRVQFGNTGEQDEVSRAFDSFLRTGGKDASHLIQRAQSEGVGSQGGYLVPEGFRNKVIERRKAFGGIAAAAEEITTDSGNPLPYPTNDDTANIGEIVPENAAAAGGADLVFGTRVLGAYKYESTGAGGLPIKVPWELLQDSAIDIQAYIAKKLAERIARKEARDWAVGSGVGEPQGLLLDSNGIPNAPAIANNTSGPTYAELLAIVHSVDPEYRENAKWVFNDATLAKVQGLVDTTGRPLLWNQTGDLSGGLTGQTLLGFPVVIDQAAPNPAASNVFGFFGDVNAAYVIRRVKGFTLVTLNELYAINGQVGYLGWERADGMVQDVNAGVQLVAAA